jgi:hypothetical protein
MQTPTPLARVNHAICDSFLVAADALARRRAREIPEPTIDELVDLRWLAWDGGTLRLTSVGEIVLMKVQARTEANAQAA